MARAQQILVVLILVLVGKGVHAAGNYSERTMQEYLGHGILNWGLQLRVNRINGEARQLAATLQPNQPKNEIYNCDNQELINNFDHVLAQIKRTKELKSPDTHPVLIKEKFSEFLKRAIGDEAFRKLSPQALAAIETRWSQPIEFQQTEMMLIYGRYMNQAYSKECNRSNGQPKLGPSWYAEQTEYFMRQQTRGIIPSSSIENVQHVSGNQKVEQE